MVKVKRNKILFNRRLIEYYFKNDVKCVEILTIGVIRLWNNIYFDYDSIPESSLICICSRECCSFHDDPVALFESIVLKRFFPYLDLVEE